MNALEIYKDVDVIRASYSGSMSSEFLDYDLLPKAEQAPHRSPLAPFSKPAPSKWDDAHKWIANSGQDRFKMGHNLVQSTQSVAFKKAGPFGYDNRQAAAKVVVEVMDQTELNTGGEAEDTKRIDPSEDSFGWYDPSHIQGNTTFIPPSSAIRSVSMRDTGTEMTPIASQEPSRTGTPVRATTPILSPTSSQPSTPLRGGLFSSHVDSCSLDVDSNKRELSEKELQMKTRREIMVLGTQLGKTNIAAWASKEEERYSSVSFQDASKDQLDKSSIEVRAAAWEEAEKAKYVARYKREEVKIQAWENLQKARTDAEMKKIEVEVERMRANAHDKLMNKLATARHKAEEKRAKAEDLRNKQARRTEQQAEYIRRTGRVPSFSCCSWCP